LILKGLLLENVLKHLFSDSLLGNDSKDSLVARVALDRSIVGVETLAH
jgi:hypothetical protein